MRRLFVIGLAVTALAGRAEALTIRDVIELTRAGVGDEVLLALIEVDRGVYAIDTETLKRLKAAGVSDRVMAALVRSGRENPAETSASLAAAQEVEPAAPPPVVVIDHRDHEGERVREVPVPVAVPFYVPIYPRSRHRSSSHQDVTPAFVPFQSGPPAARPADSKKEEPVYWGFGGKRRPDTWDADVKPHGRKR